MKFMFILGRNPKLSILELEAYLEKTENKFEILDESKNALLINLSREFSEGEIDKLGGVISIGKVLAESLDGLEDVMLYDGVSNKLNFSIWNYSEETENFRDSLKAKLRGEKLKATEKTMSRKIEMQEGGSVPNISSSNLDIEFFAFKNYFGKIVQKINYNLLEERDMNKPERRSELSISPRLSKILINLSKVGKNEKLLDPFCGIGVILSEALLQEIPVVGIDLDSDAIKGAKTNLAWFNFPKENYELMNTNSTKAQIGRIGGIASEPDLGEILKKITTKEKAKKTLRNFEKLMRNIILNFEENTNGRIVFTSPLIRTISGRAGIEISNITQGTKYELKEGFPVDEFKKNQIVGRQIIVLEKIK